MEYVTTILHIQGVTPDAVEQALTKIFADEDRSQVLRLEGMFRAVLARAIDPDLQAAYRYLICRPRDGVRWLLVLELGNRTEGLDVALSQSLGGAAVFTVFAYDYGLSGYRVARDGKSVDRYTSDPTYFAAEPVPEAEIEEQRGHPERFADLLPTGTTPEDFARVVLRPGWWEDYDAARATGAPDELSSPASADAEPDEEEIVDEVDRMRCIALALEFWGPTEYPFTEDLATIPNKEIGPAIVLAFA